MLEKVAAFVLVLIALSLSFSSAHPMDDAETYPLHIFSSGNLVGYLDPCG
ncbi:MAG: hypothetical protein ACOY90_22490 [Candidatus Zhuqueibacterota bacterium]